MAKKKIWFRRVVFVVLVLLALAAGAVIWLGVVGSDRVDAELEHVRAAGQPLSLAELVPPPIPEADNAAPLLLEAFALVKPEPWAWLDEEVDVLNRYEDEPFSLDDAWYDQVAAWVASNEPALAMAREAAARPACRFDLEWEKGLEMEFPQIPGVMALSRALRSRAILQARAGDVSGAVATCADWVRLAEIGLRDPLMIHMLVRAGIVDVALRTAQLVLARGPAATGALENLLARIEALPRAGELHRMFVWERTQGYDAFDQMREDPSKIDQWISYGEDWDLGREVLFHLIPGTMLRLDSAKYLALMRRAIDLSLHPYREVRSEWSAFRRDLQDRPWYGIFSVEACAAAPIMARKWTSHQARVDVARLGLQLEIHARRHGDLPAMLADLGAPFEDRYSGEPYVLRTTGDDGWVVYSVGPDGRDDGGIPLDDDEKGDLVWSRAR